MNFIRDCFTNDEKLWSLSRVATGVALLLSSIGFVKWAILGFNDTYFITYMGAWAGSYLASKTIDRVKPNENG